MDKHLLRVCAHVRYLDSDSLVSSITECMETRQLHADWLLAIVKEIFANRYLRKRDLLILMLIIILLCFVRLEVTKGDSGQLMPIVKESLKLFQDSAAVDSGQSVHVAANASVVVMKPPVVINGSDGNDTTSTSVVPETPPTTTPQSMMKEMLSVRKYKDLCGPSQVQEDQVKLDNDMLKVNEDADCSRASFIIFAVTSHISSYGAREKIRQSWGSLRQLQSKKLTVLFFLYSDKAMSKKERDAVAKERKEYLDVVLVEEKRAPRTEAALHLKVLQFLVFGCKKAEYMVFVNDAMLVNIPTLLEAILTSKGTTKTPQIMCKVKKNSVAMRNKKSPWFVTYQDWPDKHYPPYCDFSFGMVMSGDVVRDLLMCSFFSRRLWIADVFLTGVLAQKLQISVDDFQEDFGTSEMRNHFMEGDMSHNVFLCSGQGYGDNTWRLIFNRSLREL